MPSLRPLWQIWKGLYAVLLDKEEPRRGFLGSPSIILHNGRSYRARNARKLRSGTGGRSLYVVVVHKSAGGRIKGRRGGWGEQRPFSERIVIGSPCPPIGQDKRGDVR
jgi:hypothetical protein